MSARIQSDERMLGDRVFVLLIAVYGLLDQVEGSDAGIEHHMGAPTYANIEVGPYKYKLTIEDVRD